MNISRYIFFAACLPILAEAVDVKTCDGINGWNMQAVKGTGYSLPAQETGPLPLTLVINWTTGLTIN